MLFLLFILLIVGGVIIANITDSEGLPIISIGVGIIGVGVSLGILGCAYLGLDGQLASREARHETLVYQLENNVYDNDNDLGKRELIEDVRFWNEDARFYKENYNDLWIGIFIPDEYSQFETIPLEMIK